MSGVETPIAKSKFIAGNTVDYTTEEGKRFIRFHDTNIVEFTEDGGMKLNSGGWKTPTTKERINRFLDSGYIYQRNSEWYLTLGGETSVFYDGMEIRNNKIVKIKEKNISTGYHLKLIKRYCDKLMRMDRFPEPSGGDCWHCAMRTKEGQTMGEISKSDHIINHLKTGYIHGSIIYNALVWAGYKPQYTFHMKDIAIRALRRYLKTKLGIPC
jgi:hypothetical protein|tara:strand:- start:10767 stop:11402 length:636 start_codon:yes stop_codon:yes gene_type:complete